MTSIVIVDAEAGSRAELDTPETEGLREWHTGSVPVPVPNAQFAYRYRRKGWSLTLLGKQKPAGVAADAARVLIAWYER